MKIWTSILITLFFLCEGICIGLTLKAFLYPVKYEAYISKYATECDIATITIASIINVESGYNPNAKSKAGAIGLMQIMPDTAKYICEIKGIDFVFDDLKIPEKNIEIGCYYFKYLLNKFKNQDTAICAYNAGETIVKNWLKNTNYSDDFITLKNIPYKETKNYLNKINKNIKIYKKYEKCYKNTGK